MARELLGQELQVALGSLVRSLEVLERDLVRVKVLVREAEAAGLLGEPAQIAAIHSSAELVVLRAEAYQQLRALLAELLATTP